MYTTERRQHHRMRVDRPVKLRDHCTGKYLSALICDWSANGALIQLNTQAFTTGHRIDVAVAWGDHAILRAADMQPATVVRSFRRDDTHLIAVKFIAPVQMRLAS